MRVTLGTMSWGGSRKKTQINLKANGGGVHVCEIRFNPPMMKEHTDQEGYASLDEESLGKDTLEIQTEQEGAGWSIAQLYDVKGKTSLSSEHLYVKFVCHHL